MLLLLAYYLKNYFFSFLQSCNEKFQWIKNESLVETLQSILGLKENWVEGRLLKKLHTISPTIFKIVVISQSKCIYIFFGFPQSHLDSYVWVCVLSSTGFGHLWGLRMHHQSQNIEYQHYKGPLYCPFITKPIFLSCPVSCLETRAVIHLFSISEILSFQNVIKWNHTVTFWDWLFSLIIISWRSIQLVAFNNSSFLLISRIP